MHFLQKIGRIASAFPFPLIDNTRNFDKTLKVSQTFKWAPPQPTPPPIKPRGWLKAFLFGGFAASQPPDDPYDFYGSKVFTIQRLRLEFSEYGTDSTMSDDDWMNKIFSKLPHDDLQKPFREWAEKEQKRLKLPELPLEHKIIITDGSIEEFKNDVESRDVQTKYITLSGLEENVADSEELEDMRNKGYHHATVPHLQIKEPTWDIQKKPILQPRTARRSEWTSRKYKVLVGLYNPTYKWRKENSNVKDGYEIHLINDVVVLNEIDHNKNKPKNILGYWWRPLCSGIRTTYSRHRVLLPHFTGDQLIQFLLKTPLARVTYGVFRFPIDNYRNSDYGNDHVKWEDLPHPNQETDRDLIQHARRIQNPWDNCLGTFAGFMWKHVRSIPAVIAKADEYGRRNMGTAIHVDSIESLFNFSPHEISVFKDQLDSTVLIIHTDIFDSATHMRLRTDPGVTVHGDSLLQYHPEECANAYCTWDKNYGLPIVVTQKENLSTVADPGGNMYRNPWFGDTTKFKEKLASEKRLGGTIDELVTGSYAKIERNFLLRNWHVQLFLDMKNDEPLHLEGIYPRRIHCNPIRKGYFKDGYSDPGANGIAGGRAPFEMELMPLFPRVDQFHRCKDREICEMCEKRLDSVKKSKAKEPELPAKSNPKKNVDWVLKFFEDNF